MCYIRVRTAKDIETIANGNCGGRVLLEFLRDKIGLTAKDPEMDLADDNGNLLLLTKLSPTCNVLQVLNPRALYFPVLITEKPELKLEYLVKAPNVGGVWKTRGPLLKLKHHWEKFHTACVRQRGKFTDDEAIVVIQRLAAGRMPFSGRTRLSNRPPSVAGFGTKPAQPQHDETSKSGAKQQSKESLVTPELQVGSEGSKGNDAKSEAHPGKRARSSSAERVQVPMGEPRDTSSKPSDVTAEANEGSTKDETSRSKMIRFDLEVKTDEPGSEHDDGAEGNRDMSKAGETESLDSRGNDRKQGVIESSETTTHRDGSGTGSTERATEVTSTDTHAKKDGTHEEVSHDPRASHDSGKGEKSKVSEAGVGEEPEEIPMEIQQNDNKQATRSDSRAAVDITKDPDETERDRATNSAGLTAATGSQTDESLQRSKQSSEGINPNENLDGNESHAKEDLKNEGNTHKKSDRCELTNNELIVVNPAIDNSKAVRDKYVPKTAVGKETPIKDCDVSVDVDAKSSLPDTLSHVALVEKVQKRAPHRGTSTNGATEMQDNFTETLPLSFSQPNERVKENYRLMAEKKTNSDQASSSRTQLTISGMEVQEVEQWNKPSYQTSEEKDTWFDDWTTSHRREDTAYNTSRLSHGRLKTAMESFEEQHSGTYATEQGGPPWPVRGQRSEDLSVHWSDMLCGALCPDQQLENSPITAAKDTDIESHQSNTTETQQISGRTNISSGDTNIGSPQQSLIKDGSVVKYPLTSSNWRSSLSDEAIAQKLGEVPIASIPSDPAQSLRDDFQEGFDSTFESMGQRKRSSQAAASSRLPTEAESSDSLDVQYSPPSSRHDTPSVLGASLKHLDQLLREKHVSVSVSVVKRAESIQLGERECSKRAWERGKIKTTKKKDTAARAENERVKDGRKARTISDHQPASNLVPGAQYGEEGWKVRELERIKKASRKESARVSRSDSAVSVFRKSSDLLQNEREKEDIRRTVSFDGKRLHKSSTGTFSNDEETSNHKQATTDNKLAPDLALVKSKDDKNKMQSDSRRRSISANADDIHPKATQKLKTSHPVSIDRDTRKHAHARRSSTVDPSHDKDELHPPGHRGPASTAHGTQKKKEDKHLENKDEHKLRKDVADYHSQGRRKTRAEAHAHSAESDLTAPLGNSEEKTGPGSRRKPLGQLAKTHDVDADATRVKLGGDPSLLSGVNNKDGVLQTDKSKSSQEKSKPKSNVKDASSGNTGYSKPKKGRDALNTRKVPVSSKVSKIPRRLKKSKTDDKSLVTVEPNPDELRPEKPKLMSSASLLRKALKCPPPPPPPPDTETDRHGHDLTSHRRSSARRSQAAAHQESGARPQLVLVGSISAADLAAKVSIPRLTQEERDQYQIRPGIWMVTEKIA